MSTDLWKIIIYRHKVYKSLNNFLLFVTQWTAACQASLSITNFQSLLKLMSIEWVTYMVGSGKPVNFQWKPGTGLIILHTHIV